MKTRLLLIVALVLAFGGISKAEESASAYDNTFRSQQVFAGAYAYSAVSKNDVVALDVSNGTVANKGLGAYIKDTTTTDSIYVFGVADEDISTGTMGRVCVRGPHKVNYIDAVSAAAGQIIGTSTTSGKAAPRSTADGTAIGTLGYLMSATASTDTGDTNVYWAWVDPARHK